MINLSTIVFLWIQLWLRQLQILSLGFVYKNKAVLIRNYAYQCIFWVFTFLPLNNQSVEKKYFFFFSAHLKWARLFLFFLFFFRSMITKNVNTDEVGKIFAVVGTFQVIFLISLGNIFPIGQFQLVAQPQGVHWGNCNPSPNLDSHARDVIEFGPLNSRNLRYRTFLIKNVQLNPPNQISEYDTGFSTLLCNNHWKRWL